MPSLPKIQFKVLRGQDVVYVRNTENVRKFKNFVARHKQKAHDLYDIKVIYAKGLDNEGIYETKEETLRMFSAFYDKSLWLQ